MADIKDPKNTIVMETTKGKVSIELFPDIAPNHVARIKKLTREGFYDGCTFHRVIDGFMAQTGDPSGTGNWGSLCDPLKPEFSNSSHLRGTCSMARAKDPGSANSQFFICFSDLPFLDGQYTVWGQVIEGMENIDKLKRCEPLEDSDKIISMKIVEDPVVTPSWNQDEDIDPETKLIKQQTMDASTSVLTNNNPIPIDILKKL